MVQRQQCAFIQFATRQAAELAAEKSFNKLIVGGRRLTVKWGRSVMSWEPLFLCVLNVVLWDEKWLRYAFSWGLNVPLSGEESMC